MKLNLIIKKLTLVDLDHRYRTSNFAIRVKDDVSDLLYHHATSLLQSFEKSQLPSCIFIVPRSN